MGRFLTDVAHFAHCVPVAGSVEFVDSGGSVTTLALLQAQVTNQGDAWAFVVDEVARMLESLSSANASEGGGVIERLKVLARRVAELHVALAQHTGDAAFDPEPVGAPDVARWIEAVQHDIEHTLTQLAGHDFAAAAAPVGALAAQVVAEAGTALRDTLAPLAGMPPVGLKTRLHGDLHLGQVLLQRDDFLHHRLRRRTAAPTARSPRQAQRAARCGRHAALARLRAPRGVEPGGQDAA